MTDKEFIEKQFRDHTHYANSFVQLPSALSAAWQHPKTKKRITFSEKYSLIQKDAEKRADKIIKRLKDD